jgi:GNAT superfamily N-acetyltransferase
MDDRSLLSIFDQQIRRNPHADATRDVVEREDDVVRVMSTTGGWCGVTWSRLDAETADAVIADQVGRFGALGDVEWEWKHYDYDTPTDLTGRLVRAGFVAEPAEALLIAEIADLPVDPSLPEGVRLVDVHDDAGVDDMVRVHDASFGGDHAELGTRMRTRLAEAPEKLALVLAMAGDTPICAGRLELPAGTAFASIWGGGTVPEWRHRGVFRALVAHRARIAAAAGYRYLQVDAAPTSEPILKRLGFRQLAVTTPYIHKGQST